jgi:hypothetical protein
MACFPGSFACGSPVSCASVCLTTSPIFAGCGLRFFRPLVPVAASRQASRSAVAVGIGNSCTAATRAWKRECVWRLVRIGRLTGQVLTLSRRIAGLANHHDVGMPRSVKVRVWTLGVALSQEFALLGFRPLASISEGLQPRLRALQGRSDRCQSRRLGRSRTLLLLLIPLRLS